MKRIVYALIVTATVICAGCEKREPTLGDSAPQKPPSVLEYKKLLERRVSSVDGAKINIPQEVSTYQNASDDEKMRLFTEKQNLIR